MFNMFMDTELIQHIMGTISIWVTCKVCKILQCGCRFWYKCFLRCHIDKDFTMSIVQVHLDEIKYQNNDWIVCYFYFSQIGIVVALQPGDILMFNPKEPHCISLHCNKDDDILHFILSENTGHGTQ